jgi:mono/diheme cytochrome c family protein
MIAWRIAAFGLVAFTVTACGQSMTDQPRYDTYEPAPAFEDGTSARLPPEHTVSQSTLAYAEAAADPPDVTEKLIERGHERFDIFCSPCHGLAGYGDGMIVQRGFPAPPSFHSDRLRKAPASHFFDVITKGYGVMYSYASRVPPRDRWAIVAYIRALQLSQHASAEVAEKAGVKLP